MRIVNPSSAVIAKAKAKYGKRLTEKDYSALIKCESVADIVRYLQTYTGYRRYLDKVRSDIHRGRLEETLREQMFNSYLSLCRYNLSKSPVTGYLLRLTEIRELTKYLTLLSIGKPVEYIFSLPTYFDEQTEIPLKKLSSAHSYDEMLRLLSGHGYRTVLERFIPDGDSNIDIASISDAMEIYSLKELYSDISKIKNKSERAELTGLFDTLCDYDNYSRIMRLKRYYHLSNDAVREHLLPFGKLTGRRLDAALTKSSYKEIRAALSDTGVGRKAQEIDLDSEMAVKGRFDKCRHELYFSASPEVVLLAYYIVSETELKNLITIIEGVRYSMTPQSIREMLIL